MSLFFFFCLFFSSYYLLLISLLFNLKVARKYNKLLGSDISGDQLSNLWVKIANLFAGKENLIWLGYVHAFYKFLKSLRFLLVNMSIFFYKFLCRLMNEPHDMNTSTWFSIAQGAIDAIRAAGHKHLITVPGNCWTAASRWTVDCGGGLTNAQAALSINDPLDNFVFEMHQVDIFY